MYQFNLSLQESKLFEVLLIEYIQDIGQLSFAFSEKADFMERPALFKAFSKDLSILSSFHESLRAGIRVAELNGHTDNQFVMPQALYELFGAVVSYVPFVETDKHPNIQKIFGVVPKDYHPMLQRIQDSHREAIPAVEQEEEEIPDNIHWPMKSPDEIH